MNQILVLIILKKRKEKNIINELEELKNTVEAIESNVDVLIDKVEVLEDGDEIEKQTKEKDQTEY